MRNLIIIFGDQLNLDSSVLKEADKENDCLWMAEVVAESEYVWNSKQRIALFLSAMRHFREELKDNGFRVEYSEIEQSEKSLSEQLIKDVKRLNPEALVVVKPGEWRIEKGLNQVAKKLDIPLRIVADDHFIDSPENFVKWAEGRKGIRLEYYYRELRKRYKILMDGDGPAGGEWNFDKENRGSFGKKGPEHIPEGKSYDPDSITEEIIDLVNSKFEDHPGSLNTFVWPVNREQALRALEDFVENKLPLFGKYQDAMWQGEPYLYHSLLSSSLNLKLLNPREVIERAEQAYKNGEAPIEAVEGFVRQILGWREYVRGIYWWKMPEYLKENAMDAQAKLPEFYWTGETEYNCLKESIKDTLDNGYAHHIQRLMVTGLFANLLGVNPKEVHEWYLAVYVDAVEWVELPNTLGMSQFADGGLMASKPYVATGKYIQKMSNYCHDCRFDPAKSIGEDACPFTTLYWDYLQRHKKALKKNPRMSLQVRNLDRKSDSELEEIREQASDLLKEF